MKEKMEEFTLEDKSVLLTDFALRGWGGGCRAVSISSKLHIN